jgi:o-succinylbenzoate synthase
MGRCAAAAAPDDGAQHRVRALMRVATVEIREIRLPLKEPFRISSGAVSERRILLLRLVSADGVEGWSECVAGEQPNYSAETVDTAWLALREWLTPRVVRTSVRSARDVHELLARDVRGHRMARGALEMGIWELEARQRGVPLWRLLGGTRAEVEVGISLGIQASPEGLVERARAAYVAGYRRIKLKIAPGSDIEFVAAVRAALGAAAVLSVDANSAYSLGDTEHLARLDEYDLAMIEQPLDHEDIVRHAELQARLRTRLCLDESITSRDRAEDMIRLDAGRIINIKPGRVGGFVESIAIHDLCAARDIPVWCGGMLESGIGRGHNVALASLANFTLPGDLSPSARYWARDIVTPEWTMERGIVRVPDGPGIGVEIDRAYIDDLTIRMETVRS